MGFLLLWVIKIFHEDYCHAVDSAISKLAKMQVLEQAVNFRCESIALALAYYKCGTRN